jgi:aryl-alcohol dehydrogenase-like predicted oxidoreductase
LTFFDRSDEVPGDWGIVDTAGNPNYQEPLPTRNLALVEQLRALGDHHGLTPGALAIAWVLRDPAAIVGARRPGQLRGIVAAADFRPSPGEVAEIERFPGEPRRHECRWRVWNRYY